MGFAKKLQNENLSEWKKWYVKYDKLVELFNDEHEFIKHYLQEINKVEEFFKYTEKEIMKGKKEVMDLLGIKKEPKIEINTEVENETKLFLMQPMDAASCFGDTNSSTSSQSGLSSSTENSVVEVKKASPRKSKNELLKIEEQILMNQKKEKYLKRKEIQAKIADEEKIKETEVEEEREPEEEIKEKKEAPQNLGWKGKIIAQKDKLFKNNIFLRNYDKARKEKALLDFIVAAKHVIRFRNLNLLGFRKILIKYDHAKRRNISFVLLPILEKTHFSKSREIDNAIKIASMNFTEIYHKNNPKKAKEILKSINKKETANQLSIFISGVFLTIVVFLHLKYFLDVKKDFQHFYYYSLGSILLGNLFFGLCSVIFKFYSINSHFIFDFTVGSKLFNDKYLFITSFLLLFHQILTIFLFEKSKSFLILVFLILQCFPLQIFYMRSRFYLIGTFLKTLGAPFFQVKFKHFFLADVICSFGLSIKMFLFSCGCSICSPWMFILLWPPSIRFFQCLRRFYDEKSKIQIYNAMKYLCSIVLSLFILFQDFNRIKFLWVEFTLFFVASFYSLIWDLFFDWSIFRSEYIFPIFCYFFIVFFNVIGRFMWLIKKGIAVDDYYCLLIEVTRRFLWLLLRVEVEHLYNCNRLTAMKYVNIKREDLFYVKDYEPLNANLDSEATVSNVEI